jgi:predicted MFS family arabinose efflux permease
LLDIFDWRNLLFLQAGIILNCAVCAMLMRPLEPKKKPKRTETVGKSYQILTLKYKILLKIIF